MQTPELLVERGARLFRFLARSQQLRTASIPSTDRYEREGAVHWIARMPEHAAVHLGGRDDSVADEDGLVVRIDRVPKIPAPAMPDALLGWVDADPETLKEPVLRADRRPSVDASAPDAGSSPLKDRVAALRAFEDWLREWRAWASKETVDRPVRDLYEKLFRTHMSSVQRGEELELFLGAGLLTWLPEGHKPVSRHVFTVPASGTIDDRTGSLTFWMDSSAIGVNVELDMLDPALVPESSMVTTLQVAGAEFAGSALREADVTALGRQLVNKLAATGRVDGSVAPPAPTQDPVLTWAPALILRVRPNTGLVAAFDKIADEIAETGVVPDGLLPLLDPDRTPPSQPDPSPGALLDVDGEVFSPLPLNERQRAIIERVDRHAQTIVQGPPGTGKTHTAAALLSHLLAQGKRVLVTAHTDRALGEVRTKLPAQVRPLAVSVIGSSHSDMADLKVAVDTIGRRSVEHDHAEAQRQIEEGVRDVERLRLRRVALAEQLIASRERETHVRSHAGYQGTLAQIAQQCLAEADEFSWLVPFVDAGPDTSAPLTNDEATRWCGLLIDPTLERDAEEAALRHVDRDGLLRPEEFGALLSALDRARSKAEGHAGAVDHPAAPALRRQSAQEREELTRALKAVLAASKSAAMFPGTWVPTAVSETRAGFAHSWFDRRQTVAALVEQLLPRVQGRGPGAPIDIGGEHGQLRALALSLREHLAPSGSIKVNPDGTPKIGMFAGAAVKAARPLFEQARVGGVPPTTIEQLDLVVQHIDDSRLLDDLDRAWPDGTPIPAEDTHRERLSWHVGQLRQLEQVLGISTSIAEAVRLLEQSGVAAPDWRSDAGIEAVLSASVAVEAALEVDAAQAPLESLRSRLRDDLALGGTAPADQHLLDAVLAADVAAYAAAWSRLDELEAVATSLHDRTGLGERMWAAAPSLAAAVSADPRDDAWGEKLSRLQEAWAWDGTRAWISNQESVDSNAVQAEITAVEQRIRAHAESIAALRAWNHAVGSDRLTPGSRADLTQYAQLVRRLGKGTGKYAAQQRAEIKQAMDRCRPAVPVWILPIYRIADQLNIEQNMFDVVLIDEASQAGLEATFLQYLAPKIVVIGDDKQVSPSAVGVDQEPLRRLAEQYLFDDRYKASWQDPKRSLFDDALMRFGGQITLVEHRRCVPEIIGFSNRIAYEPDNIRLQPVRQFGADRLTPIKLVHVEDGLTEGPSGNRVNRAEARALVDAIKDCLLDPAYDGKTFGVISLTGRRQAQLIESLLLSEVSPEDWSARDLRVGDAPDFQGSERHVMFLSMVSAWEPGVRMAALTQEMYIQRYNVAVSRAQDQLWVFHTVTVDQVPREDDMRHQLLAYCDEIVRRGPEMAGSGSVAVPEDVRVEPFDSLFEQRVHNRIVERGFTVIPQLAESGYFIDLVVVGASARLAIECDGDAWHGPDAYQRDLARQRELERCGWTFCRIRESAYYVDGHHAMKDVWQALDELGILPYGMTAKTGESPARERASDDLNSGIRVLRKGRAAPTRPPVPVMGEEPHRSAVSTAPPAPASSSASAGDDETSVASDDAPAASVAAPEPAEPAAVAEPAAAAAPVTAAGSHTGAASTSAAAPERPETYGKASVPDWPNYEEFAGEVVPVAGATAPQIVDGLISIVSVEGPILGERLRSLYVVRSGGQRIGRYTADVLNKVLESALDTGTLLGDDPMGDTGYSETAFRLPGQPDVRLRTLGSRSLEQIPARELAGMVLQVAEQNSEMSRSDVFRTVLAGLGRKSLTSSAEARFERVIEAMADEAATLGGVQAGQAPSVSREAATIVAERQGDAVQAVLDLVAARGRVVRSDVIAVTGLEPNKATVLLSDLVQAGRLERRGERRGSHYVLPSPTRP